MTTRPDVPPELTRGYVTADLAPVPGEARVEPEDFVVDEVPLYEPSGEGEHLYLKIEKRGIPTHEAVRRLSVNIPTGFPPSRASRPSPSGGLHSIRRFARRRSKSREEK